MPPGRRAPALVALLALVALPGAPAAASRKLASSDLEHIRYAVPKSFLDGATALGLSVWIRAPEVPAAGLYEIVNYALPDATGGFRLYLDTTSDPDTVVFRYAEDAAHVVGVSADVDLYADGEPRWVHVAAQLDVPADEARLWIDGQVATGGGDLMMPMALPSAPDLLVGVRRDLLAPFDGEIHDVAAADALVETHVPALRTRSAFDVLGPDLVFNARLRRDDDDRIGGVEGQEAGTPERGIGPPILYDDQPPTVLVFGDTQNLDFGRGCASGEPGPANARLGRFVVEYRDTLNVQAVFHTGDWVNDGRSARNQVSCRARVLADAFNAAGVPWACTVGNHDYEDYLGGLPVGDIGQRTLSHWSGTAQMPSLLFEEQAWHDATMRDDPDCPPPPGPAGDGQRDASYAHAFEFELDGVTQLGIALPLALTTETLDWATCKAAAFAARHETGSVWLITHEFLDPAGGQSLIYDVGPRAANPPIVGLYFRNEPDLEQVPPRAAWLDHLQRIPNLAMILCGHHSDFEHEYTVSRRCRQPYGEANRAPVHQVLVNGQNAPGGGEGFVLILSAAAEDGRLATLDSETYLALADRYYTREGAEGDFRFSLDVRTPCDVDDLRINEIRTDQPSARPGDDDPDEYVELRSREPERSLDGVWYIVIGDDEDDGPGGGARGSGVIELALDLTGHRTDAEGLFLIAKDADGPFSFGRAPDLVHPELDLEDGDNVTHLIVLDVSEDGSGIDLDVDDDGALDVEPWQRIDEVSLVDTILAPGEIPAEGVEHYYGLPIGPDPATARAPAHVRQRNATGHCWRIGAIDPAESVDSPGTVNPVDDCAADLNDDGVVDETDLDLLIAREGPCAGCRADLYCDGVVDVVDIQTLMKSWGPCGTAAP